MVACSAMAVAKKKKESNEEPESSKGKWAKWKRGGIIGAAALTGGTLMAITGGMELATSLYIIFRKFEIPL